MLPKYILLTPEYKRWLKQPRREHLDDLAKEHGYDVKTFYYNGFDKDLVCLYKDGIQVSKGKQNIFHFEEAMSLIRKKLKQKQTGTTP